MIVFAFCLAAALAVAPTPQAEVRNVRISSPKIFLSREKSESDVQVIGRFKVDMSFAKKMAKKPVMRLTCLCEVNGALIASCIFLDKPETNRGLNRSEIAKSLKASGAKEGSKEIESLRVDPVKFTRRTAGWSISAPTTSAASAGALVTIWTTPSGIASAKLSMIS